MKLRFILLIVLVELAHVSFAQYMVANNDFEAYSSLPAGPGEWWKVSGWNNVNNQPLFAWPYASPDYLSSNGSGQAHLPNSVYGNVNPFAGNSVMGFVTYYSLGVVDFREYISQLLTSPMVIGQKYTISFMMTNGTSGQYCGSGCNHIGVCFSTSPLTQLQHEPINVTTQCERKPMDFYERPMHLLRKPMDFYEEPTHLPRMPMHLRKLWVRLLC